MDCLEFGWVDLIIVFIILVQSIFKHPFNLSSLPRLWNSRTRRSRVWWHWLWGFWIVPSRRNTPRMTWTMVIRVWKGSIWKRSRVWLKPVWMKSTSMPSPCGMKPKREREKEMKTKAHEGDEGVASGSSKRQKRCKQWKQCQGYEKTTVFEMDFCDLRCPRWEKGASGWRFSLKGFETCHSHRFMFLFFSLPDSFDIATALQVEKTSGTPTSITSWTSTFGQSDGVENLVWWVCDWFHSNVRTLVEISLISFEHFWNLFFFSEEISGSRNHSKPAWPSRSSVLDAVGHQYAQAFLALRYFSFC